jgi:hypothetical protein
MALPPGSTRLVPPLLVSLVCACAPSQPLPRSSNASPLPRVLTFQECSADGESTGSPDFAVYNRLKNRVGPLPPRESLAKRTVAEVLNIGQEWPATRVPAPGSKRNVLQSLGEGRGVEVTGHLLDVVEQYGRSHTFCRGTATPEDIPRPVTLRIGGGRSPDAPHVIAELTPRIRPFGWESDRLRELSRRTSFLRVSGWLLFDSAAGKTPTTTNGWIISPVARLEVCLASRASCERGYHWKNLATGKEGSR